MSDQNGSRLRPGEIALHRLAMTSDGELHGPPERIVGRIQRTTPLWVEVRARVRETSGHAPRNKKGRSVIVRLPFSSANRPLREWEADRGTVNRIVEAARRRRGMRPIPDWLKRAIADNETYDSSPRRPGDLVRVVQAIDRDVMDLSDHIGRHGYVVSLDYDSGCGQLGRHDPMVTVIFASGKDMSFWKEELSTA
jgi:hypothetical protein